MADPLLGLLASAVLKQEDAPVVDGLQRGENLVPFNDAVAVHWGTVVGLGLEAERLVKVQVPTRQTAISTLQKLVEITCGALLVAQ